MFKCWQARQCRTNNKQKVRNLSKIRKMWLTITGYKNWCNAHYKVKTSEDTIKISNAQHVLKECRLSSLGPNKTYSSMPCLQLMKKDILLKHIMYYLFLWFLKKCLPYKMWLSKLCFNKKPIRANKISLSRHNALT